MRIPLHAPASDTGHQFLGTVLLFHITSEYYLFGSVETGINRSGSLSKHENRIPYYYFDMNG